MRIKKIIASAALCLLIPACVYANNFDPDKYWAEPLPAQKTESDQSAAQSKPEAKKTTKTKKPAKPKKGQGDAMWGTIQQQLKKDPTSVRVEKEWVENEKSYTKYQIRTENQEKPYWVVREGTKGKETITTYDYDPRIREVLRQIAN